MDATAVFRAALIANGPDASNAKHTGLVTLNADRVSKETPPSGFENESTYVVISQSGGVVHPVAALMEPVFAVRCFGGSHKHGEAYAVYEKLRDRLNTLELETHGEGRIFRCVEESPGTQIPDPEVGFPITLSIWRVIMEPTT